MARVGRKTKVVDQEQVVTALKTGHPVTIGTREVLWLLNIGQRKLQNAIDAGTFPKPLQMSGYNHRVWATAEIAQWMRDNNIPFPTLAENGV